MPRLSVVIDLGGTRLRAAVADDSHRLRAILREGTYHGDGPRGVVEQIGRMARRVVGDIGADWSRVERMVVSSPGPLNSKVGVVFSPPNMPGWGKVELAQDLRSTLDVPVTLINDANAAALGEFHFGAGCGYDNLVYITVSTGIGGGVVADARLLEGTSGTAAEIGHMSIDRNGPLCPCGNRGCLELYCSGTAIASYFKAAVSLNSGEFEAEERLNTWTAAEVSARAEAGDRLAVDVFDRAGEALGFGIVNCLHLFNPEVVCLGGGVTRAGRFLFGPMRRVVERYALGIAQRAAQIMPAKLGDDAGLLGAAALAYPFDGPAALANPLEGPTEKG